MLPAALLALLAVALDAHHALARPSTAWQMTPAQGDDVFASSHHRRAGRRKGHRNSHNGAAGDPVDKYFHEATFHPHYDGRFADHTLPEDQRDHALTSLVQTYLRTMEELGAETWLMHGSLLGWWWNRKIMPWDSDIDVQMSLESLARLAVGHNMTTHRFRLPAPATAAARPVAARDTTDGDNQEGGGLPDAQAQQEAELDGVSRNYLLDINPNYVNGSRADRLNRIDARWIDTDTGLFIDITALRPDAVAAAAGKPNHMMSKDGHGYAAQDVFPLRMSEFEGVAARIPYAYSELLVQEYGKKSLTKTSYEKHLFYQKTQTWVPLDKCSVTWEGLVC